MTKQDVLIDLARALTYHIRWQGMSRKIAMAILSDMADETFHYPQGRMAKRALTAAADHLPGTGSEDRSRWQYPVNVHYATGEEATNGRFIWVGHASSHDEAEWRAFEAGYPFVAEQTYLITPPGGGTPVFIVNGTEHGAGTGARTGAKYREERRSDVWGS